VSAVDRVILRLFSLIVAASAVWAALWAFGVPAVVARSHTVVMEHTWLYVYLVVVLLLAVRYLAFPVARAPIHAFVRSGEAGEVRIGYAAVIDVADRAARQVRGVEQLHTRVREGDAGLIVEVQLRALHGTDLTELAQEVQRMVAQGIGSATSLTVAAVHVHVSGLAPVATPR
jgi:uncharacterized alkaline shock family protein YloU